MSVSVTQCMNDSSSSITVILSGLFSVWIVYNVEGGPNKEASINKIASLSLGILSISWAKFEWKLFVCYLISIGSFFSWEFEYFSRKEFIGSKGYKILILSFLEMSNKTYLKYVNKSIVEIWIVVEYFQFSTHTMEYLHHYFTNINKQERIVCHFLSSFRILVVNLS